MLPDGSQQPFHLALKMALQRGYVPAKGDRAPKRCGVIVRACDDPALKFAPDLNPAPILELICVRPGRARRIARRARSRPQSKIPGRRTSIPRRARTNRPNGLGRRRAASGSARLRSSMERPENGWREELCLCDPSSAKRGRRKGCRAARGGMRAGLAAWVFPMRNAAPGTLPALGKKRSLSKFFYASHRSF